MRPIAETEKWHYYEVNSTELLDILEEFERKGPNGYPASASWYVKWDWKCSVSVHTDFVFPKIENMADITARDAIPLN